ncbi:hypothetical protein SEA_ARGIE_69 [Mycobacterium phage Argie]|nr:hypothetical protein SEA_ARGIE_69 [Mycobacterium phage Argie]
MSAENDAAEQLVAAGRHWSQQDVQPCKHCDDRIAVTPRSSDFVHIEGDQQGKHTCAVEPYGFHAEPVDLPCGDHPANPCNGSRGMKPRR